MVSHHLSEEFHAPEAGGQKGASWRSIGEFLAIVIFLVLSMYLLFLGKIFVELFDGIA